MMHQKKHAIELTRELGSGKTPRPSLQHAAGLLDLHAPEARANAVAALLWQFQSDAMKADMHRHHAGLAKAMNAERRERGLPRVKGVPRSDLSLLVDSIWTAIVEPDLASRLAGKSPTEVFLAKRKELV